MPAIQEYPIIEEFPIDASPTPIKEYPIDTKSADIPKKRNALQLYLEEAQPAFKYAVTGDLASTDKDWATLYREANLPFSKSTSTLGQMIPETAGALLDLGTRPSSYVGAYAIPKAVGAGSTKMAMTSGGRALLEKYFPTFAKDVLAKTSGNFGYQNWLKSRSPLSSRGVPEVALPSPTTAEGGEMAGSLRLSKFPQDVQEAIKGAEPQTGPVRSFAEQRATAEGLKGSINLDAIQPKDILNAEMRRATALQIMDNAKSAIKSGNLEEMQGVYKQIIKLNGLHGEAGRLLGSLRDPLFDADDDAVKTVYDGLRRVIPESKESLAKFFKQATTPGLWDKLMEYRTASLLTSPYTQERNIIGNTIGRAWKIPERVVSAGVDSINSFITNQPRERFVREALADVVGGVRGIRLGSKQALSALMNEDFKMSLASRTGEAVRFGKAIPGIMGKVIRLPFRALNAMDEFFSTWSRTSDLYAQATRQAIRENAPDIAGRTAELASKPSLEMLANASREALKETFRQDLGKVGGGLQKTLIDSRVGKFIIPFFKTPLNLFKWTFDRSPLGIYKLGTKSFYNLSAGERADAIGKMALGQAVTAGIGYEAWQGNITGKLSDNKAKREALMRQGIMPYSIKAGDKYISYRGYEPISTWMALVANSVEAWKDKDKEPSASQVASVMAETAKFMGQQPFLMGINDVLNVLEDPERNVTKFTQNMATSVTVPTGVAYMESLLDPTIRDPENIPQAIKAKIPWLSKKVEPKLDLWGRPITKEGTLMERAINPSGVVTSKPDLVEEELLSLEKFPSKIAKKYRGIDLSIDERNIVTRVEGSLTKRKLDELVQLPEYKSLNTFEKEKEVSRVINTIRTTTREAFFNKKILNELKEITNREDKIKYIENLIEKGIIK